MFETERDKAIRKGLITPFARLEGFERQLQLQQPQQEQPQGGRPPRAPAGARSAGQRRQDEIDEDIDALFEERRSSGGELRCCCMVLCGVGL